jgi:DNA-binding SARP family transcriptional activator
MGRLTFRLFGGFEARRSAGPPVLPPNKARALLAYLACTPGQPHARDQIAALLWGDKEEKQARHSLRQVISAIRKAFPDESPECLLLEADTIALEPSAMEVDVAAFDQFVSDGSPSALEQAAAIYRGDFLAGLDVKEEMFEEWLMRERERLRELALDASAKLLSHQLKNNLDEAAIQTGLRLLALDPLQESVHQILMKLYSRNGRRGAALMQYQRCVEVLQRELGIEPELETKQFYQEILQRASGEFPVEVPQFCPSDRARRKPRRAPLEVRRPDALLIGREPEIARLRQAMREARKGCGQTIFISGEAGIGKSRLVEELGAETTKEGGLALVGRSYEIERVLPFAPWNNALRGSKVFEEPEIVQSLSPIWRAELARLFPELGEPGLEVSAAPESAVRVFEAVAHLLDCLASRQPVLLVLEDLHWSDEMSLRLFSFLSHRIPDRSVLLVGTAREEEVSEAPLLSQLLQELERNRQVISFTLSPLSREETGTLVRRLGQARIEESVLTRLEQGVWASSEGNPFIVVETMRALQEGDGLEIQSSVPLPEQVRVVVAQRLERLSDRAKYLVAVAAIIGREFDYIVLQRAAALGEREAAEGVEELVRRRVVHGVGERFDFIHDRIREVAYGQILVPRRKFLHGLVARALEEVYADNLEPHYAALGVHYRAGGVREKAVEYLKLAGQQAVQQSAHNEAVSHFTAALELLYTLPDTPERAREELTLQIALGLPLVNTKGHRDPAVKRLYTRARELFEVVGETPQLFPMLYGLWRVYNVIGDLRAAREMAEQVLRLAQKEQDSRLLSEAHGMMGGCFVWLGEVTQARTHLEQGIALYKPEQHRSRALAHDVKVYCLTHLAHTLWLLGYPDQALKRVEEALTFARGLSHPSSLAHALQWGAQIHRYRGEIQACRECTETLMLLCNEQGFLPRLAYGTLQQACVLVAEGRVAEGIAQMRKGLDAERPSVSVPLVSYIYAALADAYKKVGQVEDGLKILAMELDAAKSSGGHLWEAELYRGKGELLLAEEGKDQEAKDKDENVSEAEACFHKGLEVSRSQNAKSLELRAAMSLGRLWQKQGKKGEAHKLLAEIYGWFTEGSDTADLKEAKELLEGLSWI